MPTLFAPRRFALLLALSVVLTSVGGVAVPTAAAAPTVVQATSGGVTAIGVMRGPNRAMIQVARSAVLRLKAPPPLQKLSRPTLAVATTGGVFGVGGAVQTATRPVASLSMVQIVSALLTWSGPILAVAADG